MLPGACHFYYGTPSADATDGYPHGRQEVCSICCLSVQGAEASQQLLQQVQRALSQAQAKLQAKASSFREQLQGGETAVVTQKLADMLMANLHR